MIRQVACVLLPCLLLSGCDDMIHQLKQDAYSSTDTDAAEMPRAMVDFRSRPAAPPPLTSALIERGQSRYRIYCTPCHSETGDGHGMVVQRGFPAPPSYQIDRLRQAPTAYFVDVITNGHGAMYSFASRVQPFDRWAIAAYIRALQRSQNTGIADLTPEQKAALP
jgi:mono/diheme cytochrome c family protein